MGEWAKFDVVTVNLGSEKLFVEENYEFSKRQLLPLNLYSRILVEYQRIRAKCFCSILAQANRTRMQKNYKLAY